MRGCGGGLGRRGANEERGEGPRTSRPGAPSGTGRGRTPRRGRPSRRLPTTWGPARTGGMQPREGIAGGIAAIRGAVIGLSTSSWSVTGEFVCAEAGRFLCRTLLRTTLLDHYHSGRGSDRRPPPDSIRDKGNDSLPKGADVSHASRTSQGSSIRRSRSTPSVPGAGALRTARGVMQV